MHISKLENINFGNIYRVNRYHLLNEWFEEVNIINYKIEYMTANYPMP